jgi:hypothetical protein
LFLSAVASFFLDLPFVLSSFSCTGYLALGEKSPQTQALQHSHWLPLSIWIGSSASLIGCSLVCLRLRVLSEAHVVIGSICSLWLLTSWDHSFFKATRSPCCFTSLVSERPEISEFTSVGSRVLMSSKSDLTYICENPFTFPPNSITGVASRPVHTRGKGLYRLRLTRGHLRFLSNVSPVAVSYCFCF